MTGNTEQFLRRVMDGSDRSITAILLRLGTSCAAPLYAAGMVLRNKMYDRGLLASHDLGRPTISIGNITTGGTGKTPVVRWLAHQLILAGHHPAILMRGYKSAQTGQSDEQELLKTALPSTPVIANPDRIRGAAMALSENPATDLFILDDAMQHRRAKRNIEIVLINATEPFGYGRVFPRGMLREPLQGLRRADALLITHTSEAAQARLAEIESTIRRYNPTAPIFHCDHDITAFVAPSEKRHTTGDLAGRPYFAFCGIGSPDSFISQLEKIAGPSAGWLKFADHHQYSPADMTSIQGKADMAKADVLITTEKDWAKVKSLQSSMENPLPIWRAELGLRFAEDHAQRLFSFIQNQLPATIST